MSSPQPVLGWFLKIETSQPDPPPPAITALTGMLLCQFTMPVTLAAVYLAIPRRPGLAFGLPCLALLLGALPGLSGLIDPVTFKPLVAPLILLTALMLFVGLGKPLDTGKNPGLTALIRRLTTKVVR